MDTSDVKVTVANIPSGKTAYVNGSKITETGLKGKVFRKKVMRVIPVLPHNFSF